MEEIKYKMEYIKVQSKNHLKVNNDFLCSFCILFTTKLRI